MESLADIVSKYKQPNMETFGSHAEIDYTAAVREHQLVEESSNHREEQSTNQQGVDEVCNDTACYPLSILANLSLSLN